MRAVAVPMNCTVPISDTGGAGEGGRSSRCARGCAGARLRMIHTVAPARARAERIQVRAFIWGECSPAGARECVQFLAERGHAPVSLTGFEHFVVIGASYPEAAMKIELKKLSEQV